MEKIVFSLLMGFFKSFGNGITLVFVLAMIPILFLGMTGITDEAFAQNIEKSDFVEQTKLIEILNNPKISSDLLSKVQETMSNIQKGQQVDEMITVVLKVDDLSPEIINDLKTRGLEIELQFRNLVQGKMSYQDVENISNLDYTQYIRKPIHPTPDIVSQGAAIIGSDLINNMGNTGEGVKVAVIDLGYDLTDPEISGNVVEAISYRADGDITGAGNSAHGVAVAQIIVDVAPDVDLYLYNVNTDVELESLINFLINNRDIDVLVMSLSWFGVGPYDGTSVISQLILSAKNSGILWVNSAGNYANRHYTGQYFDLDADGFHNYFQQDETIQITAGTGNIISVILTWDEAWGAASQNYDLFVLDPNFNLPLGASSTNFQFGFHNPVEFVQFTALVPGTYQVVIQRTSATQNVNLELYSLVHDFDEYNVAAGSIPIPADSLGSFSAAAFFYVNGLIEPFSSNGPTNDGRIKPDISGPDGVTTSTIPSFFGTSAAAPYVGGAAALTLKAFPNSGPATLQQWLEDNTVPNHPKTNVDGTGLLDVAFLTDSDGDGVPDIADICPGGDDNADADFDGIPDTCDGMPLDFNRLCKDTTGNWNDAGSWFTSSVPTKSEKIILINCALTILDGETVVISNLMNADINTILNILGDLIIAAAGQANIAGTVDVNSNSLYVFGTYTVQSGGVHNNNVGAVTKTRNGGNFNVDSGGIINNAGKFITQPTGTTTVTGEWNEQSGMTNEVFGIFNIASGGVYDNESGAVTKSRNGGNFNVQSGGTGNNQGKFITQSGGATTVNSGGIVNNSGEFNTLSGATTTVSGEWNEQSGMTNNVFGTFNVASGGVYDNESSATTKSRNGGNFNVLSGGTVNNAGKFVTQSTGTATVSGEWNEQSGMTNEVFGIFNVASNGVYDNESGASTKTKNGGNFNLQFEGKVNNFGDFITQNGGTTTIDDDFENNTGGKTKNFGTMNQDCSGSFNDLGGTFNGTPIVDICPANYCSGTASCFAGVVTQHIDGDTLKVDGNSIRFALVDAPESGEVGFQEASDFIANACPVGSIAIVDEDDLQTEGSFGRMIAVVYCQGTNLNEDILDAGLAVIATAFCSQSEFETHTWAQNNGC